MKDLEAGSGKARTGGGSRVPLSQVIRWAAEAHQYLAEFDQAKPLALFHTKRLASLAQRLMLLAKDGGCSRPGCTAPAYHSQAHHISGVRNTHFTDIRDLTQASRGPAAQHQLWFPRNRGGFPMPLPAWSWIP